MNFNVIQMKVPKISGVLVLEHFDFENSSPGGIEPIIRAMAMSNSVRRWTIVGISRKFFKVGKWIRFHHDSVEVNFLPVLYLDKVYRHRKIVPDSLRYILHLLPICFKLKPSIIHVHRIEIVLFATLIWPRTPVVVFIHNEGHQLSSNPNSSSFWRFFPSLHTAVTNLALSRARRIIVFNEREFRKLSSKYAKANVLRGYSWFDPDIFYPSSNPKDQSKLVITWVGRLESEKDPILFLNILKHLRSEGYEFEAYLIGTGTLLNSLVEISQKYYLEQHLKFLGNISQESLASILRNSTVLVQTSHYEGSPTTVIESLACGTPVVSTILGDPDHVIIDGLNGYRVVSRCVVDLSEAILKSMQISRVEIQASVRHRAKTIVLAKLLCDTTQLERNQIK